MKNNGIHIRVGDILYGMIKHRILIIVLTAVGLLIGIVLSGISYLRGEMSKEYIVTSSLSVNTQTNSGLFTSGYDFPSYNDINMATDLVDSVSYVLKSDKMLKEIIDSLGLLGITTKDIADNLTFTQYNETQILEVSLYWRSSKEGIMILSEINKKAPEILMETLRIGSVSVINDPNSKYLIGGSVNIILWGYMALLGLGLGVAIVLLELIMHPTLLNIQDVESVYGLEILCEIADDQSYFHKKRSLLVEDDARSEIGESFASAAHIIQNRLRKKEGPHIIYITSALRNEGKTNMIANLAIQLSEQEKRVLMIDLDMKNPALGNIFMNKVEYEHSLNALYAGDITEKQAITSLTGYLDILPTVLERGAIPLDSNLFHVVQEVAADYDYVLMDTAPVGLTADPMSLNQIASGALFVIRYDMASMQEIKDSLERIEKSGISILGCVVNGIQVSEKGIKNPAKEKEKIKKEERKIRTKSEPLTNLDMDGQPGDAAEYDGGGRELLVAEFSGKIEYDLSDDMQTDMPMDMTSELQRMLQMDTADRTQADEQTETQRILPTDLADDVPMDVMSGQPADVAQDEPSEMLADMAQDESSEMPADMAQDEPSETPAEMPTEASKTLEKDNFVELLFKDFGNFSKDKETKQE